jgi:copper chaperone CopZ
VDLDAHVAHLTSSEPAQAVKEAVAAIRQAGYNVATSTIASVPPGITCGGCAKERDHRPQRMPGVLAVDVDVPNNTATVEVVKGTVSDESLAAALMPTAIACCPRTFRTPTP